MRPMHDNFVVELENVINKVGQTTNKRKKKTEDSFLFDFDKQIFNNRHIL